jgi:hypothetical protein
VHHDICYDQIKGELGMGKRLPQVILGLLILQFVLGMLANLYQALPDTNRLDVVNHFGYIGLHAWNALLLVVLAGWLVIWTKRNHKPMRLPSAGLGAIVTSYVLGVVFVATDNDIWSLLMAITFLGAFINYLRMVFATPA